MDERTYAPRLNIVNFFPHTRFGVAEIICSASCRACLVVVVVDVAQIRSNDVISKRTLCNG